jgi:hypothetical protein
VKGVTFTVILSNKTNNQCLSLVIHATPKRFNISRLRRKFVLIVSSKKWNDETFRVTRSLETMNINDSKKRHGNSINLIKSIRRLSYSVQWGNDSIIRSFCYLSSYALFYIN